MKFATTATAALVLPASIYALSLPILPRNLQGSDALVLKFANVLEQLESEFYKQAIAKYTDADFIAAGYTDPTVPKQILGAIYAHEQAHTKVLADTLAAYDDAALDTCVFDFSSVLTDVKTTMAVARVVELVGVGAYLGGASLITSKDILLYAGSILTIEARHQSVLNILNGAASVPSAFDQPLTPSEVLALAGGFISGCDLGIPANKPVVITNTPTPGQALSFDWGEGLFCQLIVAGPTEAVYVAPVDNCVVPADIPFGPVYAFFTNDDTPLSSNINIQNATDIAAGPAIFFIDEKDDALADVIAAGFAAKAAMSS